MIASLLTRMSRTTNTKVTNCRLRPWSGVDAGRVSLHLRTAARPLSAHHTVPQIAFRADPAAWHQRERNVLPAELAFD